MVATDERRTAAKRSKRTKPRGGDTPDPSAEGTARPRSPHATRRPKPPRVTAREASAAIERLADTCGTLDGRDRLRRLGRLVNKGSRNAQRMGFIETAIGETLDEASRSSEGVRWAACEAATWALAWMARTKRAGGSAGGILERLVGEARTAQALLATGDTHAVRFLLVVAWLFRDVEACRCLEEGAAATVAAEIERLVSDDGVVKVSGSAAMVDRVLRWTAIRDVIGSRRGGIWPAAIETRWRMAATTALRLLGARGRMLAGAGRMPDCFTAPLLDAVADLGGRRGRTARALRDGFTKADAARLLPRDLHDAASGVAILRTGWDRRSVRVMLDYRHPVPRLEIAVGDRLVFDGPWQWEAWVDGRASDAEAAWSVSCWESDRKATFIEITAPLTNGLFIERHLVVLPQDRVVLLGDTITTHDDTPAGALRYRGVVPMAASLESQGEEETREVRGFDTAARFLALPLALQEWRSGGRGDLEAADGGLVLSQEGGGRLHAPLWLDFDASRIGKPLTWRQLTVADTRVILPPHQAVGYRVQAGLEQWVVYRALDVARNRTLLGCNVACEFFLGRIRKSGEVARTLEIQ